jgi:hypothetical protein
MVPSSLSRHVALGSAANGDATYQGHCSHISRSAIPIVLQLLHLWEFSVVSMAIPGGSAADVKAAEVPDPPLSGQAAAQGSGLLIPLLSPHQYLGQTLSYGLGLKRLLVSLLEGEVLLATVPNAWN